MTIDLFTSAGQKKGTIDLPAALFGAPVNKGLIHQAIVRQRSNRRNSIAHAKNRHEVSGSTRKLYGQKHTGQARRGSIRSPLLRGGGKAFGPRSESNFEKDMPRSMRRAALCCCLSYQAKQGAITALESYPDTIKTKTLVELLAKMKLSESRKVLFVLPEKHNALWMSARNVPALKTILVSYLNPEDVIGSRTIVFLGDSIEKAVSLFASKNERVQKKQMGLKSETKEEGEAAVQKKITKTKTAKATVKKASPKKAKKSSSESSDSSVSSK